MWREKSGHRKDHSTVEICFKLGKINQSNVVVEIHAKRFSESTQRVKNRKDVEKIEKKNFVNTFFLSSFYLHWIKHTHQEILDNNFLFTTVSQHWALQVQRNFRFHLNFMQSEGKKTAILSSNIQSSITKYV